MFHEQSTTDTQARPESSSGEEDVREIRYGLTARGEAVVAERAAIRFRGFGPCTVASLKIVGPKCSEVGRSTVPAADSLGHSHFTLSTPKIRLGTSMRSRS